MSKSKSNTSLTVSFGPGSVIAVLLSWFKFHSVFWAIVAFLGGWFYVLYHLLRYGFRFLQYLR